MATVRTSDRLEEAIVALIGPGRIDPPQVFVEPGRHGSKAERCFRWDVRGMLSPEEIASLEAAGFGVRDWAAEGYVATTPDAVRFSIDGPEDDRPHGGERAGAGRKPLPADQKRIQFSVSVPPDLYAALSAHKAAGDGWWQAIERYFREQE